MIRWSWRLKTDPGVPLGSACLRGRRSDWRISRWSSRGTGRFRRVQHSNCCPRFGRRFFRRRSDRRCFRTSWCRFLCCRSWLSAGNAGWCPRCRESHRTFDLAGSCRAGCCCRPSIWPAVDPRVDWESCWGCHSLGARLRSGADCRCGQLAEPDSTSHSSWHLRAVKVPFGNSADPYHPWPVVANHCRGLCRNLGPRPWELPLFRDASAFLEFPGGELPSFGCALAGFA